MSLLSHHMSPCRVASSSSLNGRLVGRTTLSFSGERDNPVIRGAYAVLCLLEGKINKHENDRAFGLRVNVHTRLSAGLTSDSVLNQDSAAAFRPA